jgi:ABC-type lipoprotein release transport system permease subunit
MHISTENLLWTIGIIALVGIVLGVMNGFIQGLLSQITGG